MDSKRLLVAHVLTMPTGTNACIIVKESPDRPFVLGHGPRPPGYIMLNKQAGPISCAHAHRLQPIADAIPLHSGAVIELTHAPQKGSFRLDMGENCLEEWNRRASINGETDPPRTVYIKVLRIEAAPVPLAA